ncbi:hypothetical protein HHK36_020658 [Tetracentron sinense]|uniref:Peptidase A1 domain-containing protein n=1 Tax=Tetracentron sinense TaxID=13715 RepID=A0A834YVI1_TETSI|nr:hypothetical protein HHK36_020658 [Tetracentron sinense]
MASSLHFLLFSSLLLISPSHTQQSSIPDATLLPITKDAETLQYLTHINHKTPLVPIKLVLDLGGQFLWVDCDSEYVSSSHRQVRCHSLQCSAAKATGCSGCFRNNNTCRILLTNTVTSKATNGELAEDVIALQSTDGSKTGQTATIKSFLFSCAPTFLLERLASGVKGMAGLGRNRIALPSQLATGFGFHRKFAVCLPSSTTSKGVVFFGESPYMLLPNMDFSKSLIYTPLVINPSDEYFIGVKWIKINGKRVSLNTSMLSIDKEGVGGTKLSTIVPYTTLESSIYDSFVKAFIKVAISLNMTRVASVAPFGACFSSENIASTGVGPAVPIIDLVLQSEMVYWRIYGGNSMVRVRNDVLCLGFMDGGSNTRTSIVLGGHQLENNLLQFDLATSRLGFSSSLLIKQTTCSNFNFDPIRKESL